MAIGKLERVPLREVWKHEAVGFTRWLQENVDVLSEVIDLTLSPPEREKSAGAFSVDLVAEDEAGNTVVIENQLGKSDHDHLGKLITYQVALDARAAIWIVSEPRPEHVSAVAWLNESSAAGFYLVKVEAVRIGESPPAPLLTMIVGPSEESRQVGRTKKEFAERYAIRQRFWTSLLERAKERTGLHGGVSPSQHGWIGAGAGRYGLGFYYVIRQHDGRAELYIDRGGESEAENKAIFDALFAQRESVEAVFGERLEWQRLDARRACRICRTVEVGGYRDDEAQWSKVQDAMIDAMMRLEKALREPIAKLRI